eukprot:TRINITY_DN19837_c0_g3_i1.p1 TRINITY_DN19837_c0_g3~~TRINITY_DN19837_c0_g3_i1.p1  ORF type:complete len:781 (-),score=105.42 TRINITY_DN19837_c0_g3_i1:450-2792(-)
MARASGIPDVLPFEQCRGVAKELRRLNQLWRNQLAELAFFKKHYCDSQAENSTTSYSSTKSTTVPYNRDDFTGRQLRVYELCTLVDFESLRQSSLPLDEDLCKQLATPREHVLKHVHCALDLLFQVINPLSFLYVFSCGHAWSSMKVESLEVDDTLRSNLQQFACFWIDKIPGTWLRFLKYQFSIHVFLGVHYLSATFRVSREPGMGHFLTSVPRCETYQSPDKRLLGSVGKFVVSDTYKYKYSDLAFLRNSSLTMGRESVSVCCFDLYGVLDCLVNARHRDKTLAVTPEFQAITTALWNKFFVRYLLYFCWSIAFLTVITKTQIDVRNNRELTWDLTILTVALSLSTFRETSQLVHEVSVKVSTAKCAMEVPSRAVLGVIKYFKTNSLDVGLLTCDFVVVRMLHLSGGQNLLEEELMLVGVWSIGRWIAFVHDLCAFELFGPRILPIIKTVKDTVPFFFVIACCVGSLWSAFYMLRTREDPGGRIGGVYGAFLPTVKLVLFGDFDLFELEGLDTIFVQDSENPSEWHPEDPEPSAKYEVVHLWFYVSSILGHLLMANLLIGVLSSNYDRFEDASLSLFTEARLHRIRSLQAPIDQWSFIIKKLPGVHKVAKLFGWNHRPEEFLSFAVPTALDEAEERSMRRFVKKEMDRLKRGQDKLAEHVDEIRQKELQRDKDLSVLAGAVDNMQKDLRKLTQLLSAGAGAADANGIVLQETTAQSFEGGAGFKVERLEKEVTAENGHALDLLDCLEEHHVHVALQNMSRSMIDDDFEAQRQKFKSLV